MAAALSNDADHLACVRLFTEMEKVRAEVARHEGRDGKARTATRVRGRAPCSYIATRIFPGRPRSWTSTRPRRPAMVATVTTRRRMCLSGSSSARRRTVLAPHVASTWGFADQSVAARSPSVATSTTRHQ